MRIDISVETEQWREEKSNFDAHAQRNWIEVPNSLRMRNEIQSEIEKTYRNLITPNSIRWPFGYYVVASVYKSSCIRFQAQKLIFPSFCIHP